MSSSGAVTTVEAFWKDDFGPLQAAGQAVLRALRNDEAAPDADLYRRISASGDESHLYLKPTNATVTLKHLRSVPLPALLAQQLQTTKSHSLMGLLAPASLAWMTVDEKVFLWPFQQPGSFCSFQVPSGQSIIAVGLVRPKKGM
jgi:nuclear pore complex protein Nup155